MCHSKRETHKFSRHFTCRKCEGNIGEAMELEECCDEVETVTGNSHILMTGCVQMEDMRLL